MVLIHQHIDMTNERINQERTKINSKHEAHNIYKDNVAHKELSNKHDSSHAPKKTHSKEK